MAEAVNRLRDRLRQPQPQISTKPLDREASVMQTYAIQSSSIAAEAVTLIDDLSLVTAVIKSSKGWSRCSFLFEFFLKLFCLKCSGEEAEEEGEEEAAGVGLAEHRRRGAAEHARHP